MKQIKFLAAAFMLLFAVSAGAQTNTTDEGVVINGVKWATRNIDESGTFASTPASAGKLFQWNRTKAWDNTASGPVVGWNSTASTSTEWTSANDPSPTGWRVPVYEEIKSLLDTTKVSSEWAWQPGGMGRLFTDIATGNSIFFPAAGYRHYDDGWLSFPKQIGRYWSSTAGSEVGTAHYFSCSAESVFLSFDHPEAVFPPYFHGFAFSVRPVADVPVIYVTSISLDKTMFALTVGENETLTATVLPNNAIDKTVTWTSSNTNIATVDDNGKVTAVSAGTATITAKAGNKTAACDVIVNNPVIDVISISLNKTALMLTVGKDETLTATVLPDDATDKTVAWTSSNTGIATVDDNGKVIAVSAGEVTITVKAGDKTATCIVTVLQQQSVRYVKQGGTGNGLSWEDASGDLQAMINVSSANDEIWVAAGTYKPNRKANDINTIVLNNRDNAFLLAKDVKIYGSFAGTETSLEQRQLPTDGNYTSILSGDFNGNDGANFTNMTENTYHVVISVGDVGEALLDGFTITGGCADGKSNILINSERIYQPHGAGMYNFNSSPAITNVSIKGNQSPNLGDGGGMYNTDFSSPTLTNVIISKNKANFYGGGICNTYTSSPTLTNVIISGNTGRKGGGIYNGRESSPFLNKVTISENIAHIDIYGDGGGIYNAESSPVLINVNIDSNTAYSTGGGMLTNSGSFPVLINVNIVNNTGKNGGGINVGGSLILTNANIVGNKANFGGGIFNGEGATVTLTNITLCNNIGYGIYRYSGAITIRNSIIYGNKRISSTDFHDNISGVPPICSYCLVEGVTAEGVILNGENPLFVDAENGDYRLQAGSPCINAGSNTFFAVGQTPDLSAITTDLVDNTRIYDGIIDLGAYEYHKGINIKPTNDGLFIEWQPVESAEGYLLTIYSDELHTDTLHIFEFNAAGEFVREISLRAGGTTHSHTVSGLASDTQHFYTLETLGTGGIQLEKQSGNFTTLGTGTGINDSLPESAEANIIGYYSITGTRFDSEPANGVYIVVYDNGTAEKVMKK